MAAGSMVVGRFLVLILVASTLISSAAIFGYASSWYAQAALTGSIERNVSVRWDRFSLMVPGDHNKSAVMSSVFVISNRAGTNLYATVFEQRLYLLQYVARDLVADYGTRDTTLLSDGSNATVPASVVVPYSDKATLFQAASFAQSWSWTNFVSLTVEAGDLTLQICFLLAINNPPNATITGIPLLSADCAFPGPIATGGER